MAQDAIAVEELVYSYGELVAVDHISFKVAEGEILGFLGPNGAGKTTTVKMLTGQLKPKGGKAHVLGMDVARDAGKVRGEIGVCFEQTNLYEQMSALENLDLFARLFGISGFDGMALLKRVGLSGREKDKVEGYSKGMKQRLMVARSLVNRPRILFLDEPTAGLDPDLSRGHLLHHPRRTRTGGHGVPDHARHDGGGQALQPGGLHEWGQDRGPGYSAQPEAAVWQAGSEGEGPNASRRPSGPGSGAGPARDAGPRS